jgi:tRNA-uridine 2-sulfurtransferase
MARIAVSMSGGMDSFVAAYLLQKQGFDIVGVSIDLARKNWIEEGVDLNCHVEQHSFVQQMCQKLGIPHFCLPGPQEFYEKVVSEVVNQSLSGERSSPCYQCHALRVRLLLSKKEILKCDKIATGHYAKILFQAQNQSYQLCSANDLEHDQSRFLSYLNQEELSQIVLPLADIKKAEVKKIATSLVGLLSELWNLDKKKKLMAIESFLAGRSSGKKICFSNQKSTTHLITQLAASELLKKGEIFEKDDEKPLGVHDGIHAYHLGMGEFFDREGVKMPRDFYIKKINPANGLIEMGPPEEKLCRHILVDQITPRIERDISKPLTGFMKVAGERIGRVNKYKTKDKQKEDIDLKSEYFLACTLYPKPLGQWVIEFDIPLHEHLYFTGERIAIFQKAKVGAPLLVTARVRLINDFHGIYRLLDYKRGDIPPDLNEQEREDLMNKWRKAASDLRF